jgi:asparagine synthase (glutamine-hydrolysing)
MCGIAGILDLTDARPVPSGTLRRMAEALWHRGPDEDGYLEEPGVGLASRRLSIVGLADGRQPIGNEDGSVQVVYNGELFDYPEARAELQARGHTFRTHCDTELLPHLWEDHAEAMLARLRGQFALALFDRRRRTVILARDRFGICPLFWTVRRDRDGEWLLFASEIKGLLASGLVPARPDLRGIDQAFHFFALPGPATCFAGVEQLPPGHFLRIELPSPGRAAVRTAGAFWRMDFPDRGHEDYASSPARLVDEFERVLMPAVERRLRADVPVVSYLSGGIDSSTVVAMASKVRGEPIPTFTIQILAPHLDETGQAAVVSRHIGARPVVVPVGDAEILDTYPELIRAAESPVIDTSCVGLLLLARAVHRHGYKVALTGEGSDEWLAGYPWFKVHRLFSALDVIPGLHLSRWARRAVGAAIGVPRGTTAWLDRVEKAVGHNTAFQEVYSLMGLSRLLFYSPETLCELGDWLPYDELGADRARMAKWHPLHRAFFWAGRVHLAGHLLNAKGDRVAMNSSVETRYPFLDEAVFDFLARVPPGLKLRRLRDKYLLRLLGQRYLPHEVAWRPKGMFRAPLDSFFDHQVPAFVDQLLSEESLRRAGYFNAQAVRFWAEQVRHKRLDFRQRTYVELGLVGVVSTQLWHHTFIDPALADLPAYRPGALAKQAAELAVRPG